VDLSHNRGFPAHPGLPQSYGDHLREVSADPDFAIKRAIADSMNAA
jgi:hypothetical protein